MRAVGSRGRDSREASEKEATIYFFQPDTRIDEGLKRKVETKTETTVTISIFCCCWPKWSLRWSVPKIPEWVVLPLRYSHCGCHENFHIHESVNNRFPQSLLDTTLFEISFFRENKMKNKQKTKIIGQVR